MSDATFSSVDELIERYDQAHSLKEWGILTSKQGDKSALVLHSETEGVRRACFILNHIVLWRWQRRFFGSLIRLPNKRFLRA